MRFANVRLNGRDALLAEHGGRAVDVSDVLGATSVEHVLRLGELPDDAALFRGSEVIDLDDPRVTYRPVGDLESRMFCAGFNFRSHATESGVADPPYPTLFYRGSRSVVGHGQPIVAPFVSDELDWEGELALVIGTPGRHIPADRALSHVAGYTVFAENSVRDWQGHTNQVLPGKNFDDSGATGPWLVAADDVPDYRKLTITTRVNGIQMQHGSLSQLIFDIPAMIAYVSSFTRLQPGDIIAMGTPSGVGGRMNPPRFLKPGDDVEVEIPTLGVLRNTVIAEAASEALLSAAASTRSGLT